jgi:hypothetical protein
MPTTIRDRVRAALAALTRRTIAALRHAWRTHHADSVPIQVLLVDGRRRRAVERDLAAGLRRIRRALGRPLPDGLAVLVQDVLHGGSSAGCHARGADADGRPLALVRLALRIDGRAVTRDELLAALAEQVLALALSGAESAGPLAPDPAPEATDPLLLPHPNGHGPRLDRAAA